jgi:hypothetical protein
MWSEQGVNPVIRKLAEQRMKTNMLENDVAPQIG